MAMLNTTPKLIRSSTESEFTGSPFTWVNRDEATGSQQFDKNYLACIQTNTANSVKPSIRAAAMISDS